MVQESGNKLEGEQKCNRRSPDPEAILGILLPFQAAALASIVSKQLGISSIIMKQSNQLSLDSRYLPMYVPVISDPIMSSI